MSVVIYFASVRRWEACAYSWYVVVGTRAIGVALISAL